jgi:4-hydroxy-tetrahydrodipicolinate synthase
MVIKGSIVALVTPMNHKGEVDYQELKNLVEWHISQQTDGIVVVGTTGESCTLTSQEAEQVIRETVGIANKRIPIIAGTGNSSTQQTIEQTQRAMSLGADGALIITPYYNRPTQEGLFLHYQAVAHSVPGFPIILYNNPGRTGCDLKVDTVAKLSEISNIYGIKDPTGDLNRVYEHQWHCRPGFKVYSGDDPTCLNFMLAGGDGVISITANVAPKMMHDLAEAALTKQETMAREINAQLARVHQLLVVEPNPIPVKWALSQAKKITPSIRLPLTSLSPIFHAEMLEQLKLLGLYS